MTKITTRDDVLRYIYNETSIEEAKAIQKQLLINGSLMDFYNQAVETINKIMDFQLEPSPKSQDKLIQYSASLKAESIS